MACIPEKNIAIICNEERASASAPLSFICIVRVIYLDIILRARHIYEELVKISMEELTG